jgi:hypothetical protein
MCFLFDFCFTPTPTTTKDYLKDLNDIQEQYNIIRQNTFLKLHQYTGINNKEQYNNRNLHISHLSK